MLTGQQYRTSSPGVMVKTVRRAASAGLKRGKPMLSCPLPRAFLALGLALGLSFAALAQSPYPNRPVKILVGFTAGTAPDLAARILADRFSDVWGTPFVVENVPGAGSNVAAERVARGTADGY